MYCVLCRQRGPLCRLPALRVKLCASLQLFSMMLAPFQALNFTGMGDPMGVYDPYDTGMLPMYFVDSTDKLIPTTNTLSHPPIAVVVNLTAGKRGCLHHGLNRGASAD